MSSFLSRMANEATAALSDAYGHVMHGDDAGSSARIIWVVHPTRVAVDMSSGDKTMDNPLAVGEQSESSPARGFGYTQKFDLGLTFLEINDRAYVRTVSPKSHAAQSGIQPQDCVQFACVVGGPQFESDLESIHLRQSMLDGEEVVSSDNMNSPGSVGSHSHTHTSRQRRKNKNTLLFEREELEKEKRRLDVKASQFAFECEKRGMRTSYDELRNIFVRCTLLPSGDRDENDVKLRESLVTPQRKSTGPSSSKNPISTNADDLTIDDSNSILDSIGGVFEKGKSKKYPSSRCVPAFADNNAAKVVSQNVTSAAKNASACFVPEDRDNLEEGDEIFMSDQRRSHGDNMMLDTPTSPIKNEGLPSPHRRQRGADGRDDIVYTEDQQLYPVVIVFRRTVQRKQMSDTKKGLWSSPGLSLRGSLFGIPSFRMDDECDRAAALVRQLAPSVNTAKRDGPFGDDGENSTIYDPSVATSPEHRSGSNNATNDDNIEASTIRGMIQNAVGLGFVRTSKVVVGVSLQAGSGIIIARLPDGTWSAPSAIGVYGLGVGMQFGLEVADYMFILQTKEGVEHFKRGGNFALGGNIGISVANCGREAYGAASLGACAGSRNLEDQIHQDSDDEGFDDTTIGQSTVMSKRQKNAKDKNGGGDIAPMVAYASSRGLYFGMSVDGLKFFTRNDLNSRAYKFSMLSETAAKDILGGLVAPPREAEDLYAALHSVEYVHDVNELPRPPKLLRKDSMNDWRYDRSTIARKGEILENNSRTVGYPLYSFLSTLNPEEADEFAVFETKFKKFMYGGVSVERLLPNAPPTRSGMTRREKRTLWLMLPEVGSLRLGYVSKLKDDNGYAVDEMSSIASSIAPSRTEENDQTSCINTANVKLSRKQSMSMTDVTLLSQDPYVTVRLSPDDATEHLRIISIEDATGKSLLFIAGSNHEAELLVCGLKLLLECESARLGVRGGVPLNKLGGKLNKGAVSPTSARGSLKSPVAKAERSKSRQKKAQASLVPSDRSTYSSIGDPGSSSDSDNDEVNEEGDLLFSKQAVSANVSDRNVVPEKRSSWSQLPSRAYLRQAADSSSPRRQTKIPTYELGKEICNDIATNISLNLPLAVCRVLFLDSTSPVISAWEDRRGDNDFRRTGWTWAPGSPREYDENMSEQQLISSGSMAGAQRTVSYGRKRNKEMVRLSETIAVESDDSQKFVFTIIDRMPRRGFAAKARVIIRSFSPQSCEARVTTELRPAGKNLNDQSAVHKAYLLVLDEMKMRYGAEGKGLLAVFLDVYSTVPASSNGSLSKVQPRTASSKIVSPSKTSGTRNSSMTSFKDVLPLDKKGASNANSMKQFSALTTKKTDKKPSIKSSSKHSLPMSSFQKTVVPQVDEPTRNKTLPTADEFADFSNFPKNPNPVTVEVKPLPKIRLDLCPVPREEDEEEDSSVSISAAKLKKKSKPSKSKARRKSQKKQ